MLAKILVALSAWSLLSVIAALLVAKILSTFREVPTPGYAPPIPIEIETDWEDAALKELEEEEMLVLAHQ